jgi:hypothetical protein
MQGKNCISLFSTPNYCFGGGRCNLATMTHIYHDMWWYLGNWAVPIHPTLLTSSVLEVAEALDLGVEKVRGTTCFPILLFPSRKTLKKPLEGLGSLD